MTTYALILAALAASFALARRSLTDGLIFVMTMGFAYGFIRANAPGLASYLLFDAAVAGLFAAMILAPAPDSERGALHDVTIWLALLIGWPLLLFVFFRRQDFLIELVGLRANVFLLPFMVIGARLRGNDLRRLALALAILDIAACAFGLAQYYFGIQPFLPENEATELIYRSHDLVGYTQHRIPSSFINAHAFAGTLVLTLPFIGGAWLQRRRHTWERFLWPVAIAAVLLSVFMSATRTHTLSAVALVIVITFSGRLTSMRSIRWVVVLLMIVWVVAVEERFQRFTTLAEGEFLNLRLRSSINAEAFDLMAQYPMGNGLAGGGTNVPYFFEDRHVTQVGLENEYVRIAMEQGLPGLFLWLLFVIWILARGPGRGGYPWARGRRLAWVAGGIMLVGGLTGTGMLSAIPQSSLLLLLLGWVGRRGPVVDEDADDEEPSASSAVLPEFADAGR